MSNSYSCPLSWYSYPPISSSAVPFSSCLQSFPTSGFFPIIQLFTSGGQSIGDSASVLSVNIQSGFPLGLTGLISLQSMGLWRVLWPLYKHLELLYIIKCWIPVSTEEEKVIGIWRRYKRGQIIRSSPLWCLVCSSLVPSEMETENSIELSLCTVHTGCAEGLLDMPVLSFSKGFACTMGFPAPCVAGFKFHKASWTVVHMWGSF